MSQSDPSTQPEMGVPSGRSAVPVRGRARTAGGGPRGAEETARRRTPVLIRSARPGFASGVDLRQLSAALRAIARSRLLARPLLLRLAAAYELSATQACR